MNMAEKKDYSLESKWSSAIMKHGYVVVPNLLILHRDELNISNPEFLLLICIESFRWTKESAWPSIKAISRRAGLSPRQTRTHISSLEKKGLIKRNYRTHGTTVYSVEPLIDRLDRMAVSHSTLSGKQPPRMEETRVFGRRDTSAKEDTAIRPRNIPSDNTAVNSSTETVKSIAKRRLKALDDKRKPNDFGKNQ
jgi:hypothetical protein